MNPKKILSGIIVISVFSFLLVTCSLETKSTQPYLIRIDSLKVPDAITSKVQFEVSLFGTIGPNGCYSFEKFYYYATPQNEVIIEVWGRYQYDGTTCTGSTVYLNEKIELTISLPGVYTIKVLKPDSNYLVKEITVN